MQGRNGSRSAVLQWVVVLVVGVLVVTVVLGLNLIPRLDDGQKVLDAAEPAFTPERVASARAGIDIISKDVDMADPIVNPQGGAAAEVPTLIAFVSQKTGLTQAQVVAALQKNFPHTTALLEAIPLSAITAEQPRLFAFLEQALHLSPAQLLAALKTNFPALTEAITNLPTVTSGWDQIQNIGPLTNFAGTPIRTAPEVRTYFSSDLIPVLERQQSNFSSLDGTSRVNWVAPLLLVVGAIVILFALLMIALNLTGRASRGRSIAGASVVLAVGTGVTALVLVLALVPRVSNGQKLLNALEPVNGPGRVQGARAGIDFVSAAVNSQDPIMTQQGGAAAEVPKLIAFVSQKTGLTQPQVVAALQKNFPHTTALLEAIPLSSVTAEFPRLFAFLEQNLHVSQAQLVGALQKSFPALTQSIANLPAVTSGWTQVPNIAGATRFDGRPIETVPDVRTYFSSDVIPVLETQHGNYEKLVATSRIDFIGPLVLAVGIIVILYGLLMLLLAWNVEPEARAAVNLSPSPVTS